MFEADLIYRLLYRALVEIRDSSREHDDKVSYHLADLFHVTALELSEAASGNRSYADVMESLRKRAEAKNCGPWISERLDAIQETANAQSGAGNTKLAG